MLDLAAITREIDRLLDENKGEQAERLMQEGIAEAVREEDDNALLTLLNELIGYYRETSQAQASYQLAAQARSLLDRMGLQGTIPYATTLLNIANAYRAGGRLEDSEKCYQETMEIYGRLLPEDDMLVASLHNNLSLLYQEMGDFPKAKERLLKALEIVKKKQDVSFELAVTYSNLAATCLKLDQDEEAAEYFRKAIAIFESRGIREAHYSAAVASLGTYYYKKGEYGRAAESFRKAMDCVRSSLGENEHYRRLQENLLLCEEKLKGMALCREYYEAYGKPMIQNQFGEYADRIAAGLVGEGSDCFGYDDGVSQDHDWGPAFCLWVSQETWEQIGERLEEAYEKLPEEYKGCKRIVSPQGSGRRGVQTINGFYGRLLCSYDWEKLGRLTGESQKTAIRELPWQQISDASLAASVNGQVFCDPEGIFSSVRQALQKGYPEPVLYLKLAESAARFAQAGQYNYGRMLKRKDPVTARILLGDCLREAMKLCFYLENTYPPHDKWLKRGLRDLKDSGEVSVLLEQIAQSDSRGGDGGAKAASPMEQNAQSGGQGDGVEAEAAGFMGQDTLFGGRGDGVEADAASPMEQNTQSDSRGEGVEAEAAGFMEQNAQSGGRSVGEESSVFRLIEQLGSLLAAKLYEKGYISDTEAYLDAHTVELLMKARLSQKSDRELVEDIAKLEFETFDKVRNVGGRADCQNDWYTFRIMRESQYLTWNRPMLLQYLYDFHREVARGHNLITEKYGRMMESTAPEEYEGLKEHFPMLSPEKKAIIEAIVGLQVGWMEEFEAHYPVLAGNARSIHTAEDNLYNTSYETYLRGEISTYSDKMLELYGRYVVEYAQAGKNLTYAIMTNSVKMYGYPDLQKAEEEMGRFRV